MSIEQYLQEFEILKVKIGHIFNCIENHIYLKIGPHFNKLYLECMRRYLHSVKSNDPFQAGRFDCKNKGNLFLP